ncbi:cystathionine gamma-synthase [Agrococcus sp. SCSIO52902]|uniref:cystathionine gamma-synthase n=1 Tax=Agrococcus sp. SCSIO52902 TaxID=2933290 RepID=UPI001FF46F82|nr:cystathionine gamma-synthase [Agrococcus sp. SCSIO52902]UOW01311.1 cystathionine gamma-synthase [Agrococcus sp. SCSIO52902]
MTASTSDGFSTRAIHDGQGFDPRTGAVIPPIFMTSTFVQDGVGGFRDGYEYSRGGNPSRDALQQQLASLEGGTHAFAFGSGLAAEDAVLRAALQPGDHVLMGNDVYGGTHRLVSKIWERWGIELSTADASDLDAVRAAMRPSTRMLWVETPSNPLMKVADLPALAELGHDAGALVVADNTFATPYLQQPLGLGADVVVHSTTKYIGGHSDLVGGAAITGDAELAERIGFQQFAVGAVNSPFDAWLTSRSLKTLAVRVERHCTNARAVAESLVGHPAVSAVHYPGLPDHPQHALAARQMRGFGGMVSLQLAGGAPAALELVRHTRLFQLAESLGGVESLVCYPSEMTHASVRGTELEVPADLLRLSVGLEEADDLIADLRQALGRL